VVEAGEEGWWGFDSSLVWEDDAEGYEEGMESRMWCLGGVWGYGGVGSCYGIAVAGFREIERFI
jgi:hypothetical protein